MAKHFSHKIIVDQDESGAVMHFPAGTVAVRIGDDALHLSIKSEDTDAFEQVREVLIGHMLRFAHREAPTAPIWHEG